MSQLIDLLSYELRKKLLPYWHAATNSEKSFKEHYSSVDIMKMDVASACEEIQQMLHLCNNEMLKSILHLSSQLMYGLAKIQSYQTAYYEKEVLRDMEKLEFLGL